MTQEKSYAGWYFLLIVLIAYIVTLLISNTLAQSALDLFADIILKVAPILLVVFIFTTLINYFVTPKILIRHLGKKSGAKGWIVSIIAGIISTGPIYMWYPLLNDLQKQGMRNGLIAAFLYNRAVKLPLLPMLILYFGYAYAIVLLSVMVIISVFQGMLIEKLVGGSK